MDWLDDLSHPILRLDGESIEVVYQPVTHDPGPGTLIATFRVQCLVRHPTGTLIYSADDLSMFPSAFAEFARDLKRVLDGDEPEARLAPIGRELVMTVSRTGKSVNMTINIVEWEGPFDPETVASAGRVSLNIDRAYRWAWELGEYGRQIEEWVLANPTSS